MSAPLPPPPYVPFQQPSPAQKAEAAHRASVAMIVIGVLAAGAGLIGMEYIARAYDLCNSGLGALAQATSHQAQVNCGQDTVFHGGSLLAIGAGVLLAGAGIVRVVTEKRAS